jgi:hypothetical protein
VPAPLELPTADEIEAAWKEIVQAIRDGDDSERLGLLVARSPVLMRVASRMCMALGDMLGIPPSIELHAFVSAQIMTGLNYGLRIGAARASKVRVQ